MRKTLGLGLLGVGLMVSPLFVHFAGGAVPVNPKIAVVDIEGLLANTPVGKRAISGFETVRKAKQDAFDKEQSDLKKQATDLQKQQAVLKPDVLAQKEADLQKQAAAMSDEAQKAEKELATERSKMMQDVLAKIEPVILDVAKAEGVQMVIEKSAVVWIDPSLDLTAAVAAKLK